MDDMDIVDQIALIAGRLADLAGKHRGAMDADKARKGSPGSDSAVERDSTPADNFEVRYAAWNDAFYVSGATLADEIRAGLDVRAIYLECGHSSVLSARELATRLGEEFPVRRLIGRLRCHQCRGTNADVLVHQPSRGQVAEHGPSKG